MLCLSRQPYTLPSLITWIQLTPTICCCKVKRKATHRQQALANYLFPLDCNDHSSTGWASNHSAPIVHDDNTQRVPVQLYKHVYNIWWDFDRASSLICENKMPTRCNRGFYCRPYCLLKCFEHHYIHHQELKSIIQWLLPVVFRAVVFKLQPLYNTLELLMMGIVVLETC